MSAKRPPAPAPHLPGYRYVSLLGSGGFSDVYLYEQERPRRKVAIKVLLSDLRAEGARRRFESEANLMAQLSSHPYIVTIYEAEVTDAGHSYLAMEYCSRPSLDLRYRNARFSVDEVLAIGIQVSSAVETAHRAGIVHRDIKPANILVTDYNRPALTDFGISGTMDAVADEDAGLSIPWSPPESFTGGPVDGVKVDVWALAATLYTLLAGRSPFLVSGGDNSQRALVSRISDFPLPRLGRADVPESLELALATAMSKSPASRYASAQDFARALMRVQTELNLSVTPFEVLDDSAPEEAHPDDRYEETRVRSITAIDPDATGDAVTGVATRPVPSTGEAATAEAATAEAPPAVPISSVPGVRTHSFPRDEAPLEATVHRSSANPATAGAGPAGATGTGTGTGRPGAIGTGGPGATRTGTGTATGATGPDARGHDRRRTWMGVTAAAVLVLAVVVAVVLANVLGTPEQQSAAPSVSRTPSTAVMEGVEVPQVGNLVAEQGEAGATWRWDNPQPQDGDSYLWAAISTVEDGAFAPVSGPGVFVANNVQGQSCIAVKLVRRNGQTSKDVRRCAGP
jgi:serine/threonine-protein kinase PknK